MQQLNRQLDTIESGCLADQRDHFLSGFIHIDSGPGACGMDSSDTAPAADHTDMIPVIGCIGESVTQRLFILWLVVSRVQ